MSGVQKLMIDNKEIWFLDYSDCNQDEMIAVATKLTELGLAENKRMLVLTIYDDKNFVTPRVMRHFERLTSQIIHLIDKAALVGLSPTKKIILKGYNLLFQRNFLAFDSKEDAIAFLLSDEGSKKG